MRDDPGFSRWPLRRKEKRQLHFPDSLALGVAYQFRRGKDVNRDFFRGVEDFHENVVQHRVLLSAVIYF